MERLRRLLTAMANAKLTINLLKSEWGHAKITFLGHVVGAGDVSTIPAKVEAIKKFPVRKTRKEVMRFLGMGGYYRKFCPNISTVVHHSQTWSARGRDSSGHLNARLRLTKYVVC